MFPRKSVAIPVSGGVDSYVAVHLAEYLGYKPKLFYVDFGHPYSNKEITQLTKKLFPRRKIEIVSLSYINKAFKNTPTKSKQEILGRNLLIATLGANLASTVWICALETEITPVTIADKRPSFFSSTSVALTLNFRAKHPKGVTVTTPYRYMSKTEVIKYSLEKLNIPMSSLLDTVSCYSPTDFNCGKCLTCFKRWVAFINNGVHIEFTSPIGENLYGITTLKNIKKCIKKINLGKDFGNKYTYKRIVETSSAVKLAHYDKKYLNKNEDPFFELLPELSDSKKESEIRLNI